MSDVPPEVISEIFTRLPVKSLLRFRCLSKPYRDLIDSPDFIKSHLQHSLISNSHTSIITINHNNLYSIDFDLFHKSNILNFPGTIVVGSCNGLICLFLSDDDIFLCNPWTRKHRKLPVSEIEFPGNPFFSTRGAVTYGFGYDHVNDDYKVVRIVLFSKEVENEVKVYSLKSNSWRRIKDFPFNLCCMGSNVLVNGALHWVASFRSRENVTISENDVEEARIGPSDDYKIISLDLATEEYHLVPLPRYSKMTFLISVGELGGKLCVHSNYHMRHTDIWVMNHYGEKDSWTKLFSVAVPVDIRKHEYLRAIAYSKDEKQVLVEKKGEKLLWYDINMRTVKPVRIPGISEFFYPYISHGSLVKLTDGARKNVTREKSKTEKRAKRDDFLSKGFKLKL